ncbi:UDP-glucose dehydrogenase family protein [Aestuariispira ectoiniformans]|uniref:UDP-glucose dehydrogenase family protein n=1 Tax=Aestuariispira ectoiniformans TaxID=2775080 RepID=UPI00223AD331|nr:UDP-glucose/GDP-mannose dehydrogenase family protein [Aestuariispira ectoiniformans]
MRIAMIGTGYVGLVSGACFSQFGHDVICVDVDENKISRLKKGEIPIYEPGLDKLVSENAAAGRLAFTTDIAEGLKGCDAVFIAVGTPTRPEDGHADLKYVFAAAEDIARNMDGYTVVVDKSTVPVGTARKVYERIAQTNPDADFDVVSNPEFLREGAAIDDFMHPDRVVLGGEGERAMSVMRKIYEPIAAETKIVETGLESAELIKYAANAFLAVKISFINELADLCEKVGGNVGDVAVGMGLDSRIGEKFLQAGPGYGGSCFPKDTLALAQTATAQGAPVRIVETVIDVNSRRKRAMADRVAEACGGSLSGKTVAVLGVTFKAETDDMRDSPALDIVPALQNMGAVVRAYDPQGMDEAAKLLNDDVQWMAGAEEAMGGADVAVIITEWREFRELDLQKVKSLLKDPVIVDLRNLYEPADMVASGLRYHSIGRQAV